MSDKGDSEMKTMCKTNAMINWKIIFLAELVFFSLMSSPSKAQFTQQKLVGTGWIGISGQGSSVSISADGGTAILGANFDDNYSGAAWIFIQNAGVWIQQAKLIGTGAVGSAQQGCSVSLSAG